MAPKQPSEAMKLAQKIHKHKTLAALIAQHGLPEVMPSGLTEHERKTITERAGRIRQMRRTGQANQPRPTAADLQRKGITQ